LSAIAFSLAHGVPFLMPKYFVNGLMLAWLCHRTRSLWPPFALHAGWNIFALQVGA
jgi:membrane protease YdiL (CAAX protease family)